MAKDALGHGSDTKGLGNGPDPRGLRSHIQMVGQGGFSGKVLGTYSPSSAGQSLVNAVRGGGGTVDVHPSMAGGKSVVPRDVAARFARERAESAMFRSGQREINRLRRQGK